jgi:hypothetical protein
MRITYENKDRLDVHEYEVHKWSAEASTLGLKPGEWPRTIETELGNGMVFIAMRREVRDGDLLWVDYLQGNGCIWLRIYND